MKLPNCLLQIYKISSKDVYRISVMVTKDFFLSNNLFYSAEEFWYGVFVFPLAIFVLFYV